MLRNKFDVCFVNDGAICCQSGTPCPLLAPLTRAYPRFPAVEPRAEIFPRHLPIGCRHEELSDLTHEIPLDSGHPDLPSSKTMSWTHLGFSDGKPWLCMRPMTPQSRTPHNLADVVNTPKPKVSGAWSADS